MVNPIVLTINTTTTYTRTAVGTGLWGWYNASTVLNYTWANPYAVNATTQYGLQSTQLTNATTGLPITYADPVTITGAINVNATYGLQYYLTVNDQTATATGAGWYYNGTTATFAVTTPYALGTGQQSRFTGWSGDSTATTPSSTIVMIGPHTVTAGWVTQYLVTVTSPYGNVGGSGWYDTGATATIGVDVQASPTPGTLELFTSWSNGNTNPTFTVTVTSALTYNAANWKTQYYLTVLSDVGSPTGSGWYDSGSTATFAVTSPVTAANGTGTQYVFSTWQGDASSTSASATIVMNGPKTVNAYWTTQYQVTVTGSASGGGWVNAGASTTATSASDSQWSINGENAGYGTSVTTPVNGPITIDASTTSNPSIASNTMLIVFIAGVVVAFVVILGTLVIVLRKPKV